MKVVVDREMPETTKEQITDERVVMKQGGRVKTTQNVKVDVFTVNLTAKTIESIVKREGSILVTAGEKENELPKLTVFRMGN